jgi:hypothetical protein
MMQLPAVHGTPPQQSASTVQIWPYCAQAPEPPAAGAPPAPGAPPLPAAPPPEDVPPTPPAPPAPDEPPAPGGGGGMLQVPFVEPRGSTQVDPGQQSALMLHDPPAGTHAEVKQRSMPESSGTHGAPLQQSLEDAHSSPVLRQAERPLQRGTPSLSSWQQSLLAMQPQQSLRADEIAQA